jgi:hypothetical protein
MVGPWGVDVIMTLQGPRIRGPWAVMQCRDRQTDLHARGGAAIGSWIWRGAGVAEQMIEVKDLRRTFIGPLGDLMSKSPAVPIVKALSTYYIAEGVYNTSRALGPLSTNLRDIGGILGSTVVLLLKPVWILWCQSAVAGAI